MVNKKNSNNVIAFVNAVASGMDQYKAYLEFIAKKKTIKKDSATSRASKLLRQSNVVQLLNQAIANREIAMKQALSVRAEEVAKEFCSQNLTIEELDSFHTAVIRGIVEVEENVAVYTWNEFVDENGKVYKRTRTAGIMKAKRPPNVREKQISVDALYRRRKAYPAVNPFGPKEEDGSEGEAIPYIILADGSELKMFP